VCGTTNILQLSQAGMIIMGKANLTVSATVQVCGDVFTDACSGMVKFPVCC
jgi:hypothetical protein